LDVPVQLRNVDKVIARLDAMTQRLQSAPIAPELTDWQIKDMRRHYPQTEARGADWAQTIIYPRSRKLKPKVMTKPKLVRGPRRPRQGKPRGQRPILRPALLDQLRARLKVMMRKINWKKPGEE